MTDLDLIKNLEEHAGFVLNRLTCDGNIYANAINLGCASKAQNVLIDAFINLRKALKKISREETTADSVILSMQSFDINDWQD